MPFQLLVDYPKPQLHPLISLRLPPPSAPSSITQLPLTPHLRALLALLISMSPPQTLLLHENASRSCCKRRRGFLVSIIFFARFFSLLSVKAFGVENNSVSEQDAERRAEKGN
jgi:hypothetical protein